MRTTTHIHVQVNDDKETFCFAGGSVYHKVQDTLFQSVERVLIKSSVVNLTSLTPVPLGDDIDSLYVAKFNVKFLSLSAHRLIEKDKLEVTDQFRNPWVLMIKNGKPELYQQTKTGLVLQQGKWLMDEASQKLHPQFQKEVV